MVSAVFHSPLEAVASPSAPALAAKPAAATAAPARPLPAPEPRARTPLDLRAFWMRVLPPLFFGTGLHSHDRPTKYHPVP